MGEDYRTFCYSALGFEDRVKTNDVVQSLREGLGHACDNDGSAADVFDVAHVMLCDHMLRNNSAAKALSTQLLLLVAGIGLASDACDATKDLAMTYLSYYSKLSAFKLNERLASCQWDQLNIHVILLSRYSTLPCVLKWVESNLLGLNPSERRFESTQFSGLRMLGTSLSSLRYSVLFFDKVYEQLRHSSSIPEETFCLGHACSSAFNECLKAFDADDTNDIHSYDTIQKASVMPAPLRSLLEAALSIVSAENHPTWVSGLLYQSGREDIVLNTKLFDSTGDMAVGHLSEVDKQHGGNETAIEEDEDLEGFGEIEKIATNRFPDDRRVSEVCRLLRSSKSLYLRLDRTAEADLNDPLAYRQRQQSKLLALCRRSLAVICGRGALTYGSLTPVVAEILPIPPISLKGRCPPNNNTVRTYFFLYTYCYNSDGVE
jgi:hypothetical protein